MSVLRAGLSGLTTVNVSFTESAINKLVPSGVSVMATYPLPPVPPGTIGVCH